MFAIRDRARRTVRWEKPSCLGDCLAGSSRSKSDTQSDKQTRTKTHIDIICVLIKRGVFFVRAVSAARLKSCEIRHLPCQGRGLRPPNFESPKTPGDYLRARKNKLRLFGGPNEKLRRFGGPEKKTKPVWGPEKNNIARLNCSHA